MTGRMWRFVGACVLACVGCEPVQSAGGCQVQDCSSGECTTITIQTGESAPMQVMADCRLNVCGGMGTIVAIADDTDIPADDGNPCTSETCNAGIPMHPAGADGNACYTDGACGVGNSCLSGQCVGPNSVACASGQSCNQGVCTNNACTGTVALPISPMRALGPGPTDIEPFDLNGDGKDDIAVSDGVNNVVSVIVGYGNGLFSPQTDYPVGAKPIAVDSGDVNGDGAADIVVANEDGNTISVLLNNKDGTLAPRVDLAAGTAPTFVYLVDVDQDGHLDIVTAASAPDATIFLLNDGSGGFAQRVDHVVTGRPTDLDIVDMGNDGSLDILAAYGTGVMQIFNNNAQGAFTAGATLKLPFSSSKATRVRGRQLNNDGLVDVVAVGAGALYWLWQNPDKTFSSVNGTNMGVNDASVVDLDQDGNNDLVLSLSNQPVLYPISVNNGMKNFVYQRAPIVGLHGKIANIDGAGTPGFVALSPREGVLGVVEGEGVVVYEDISIPHVAPYELPIPSYRHLSVVDMNGDHLPDLVSVNAFNPEGVTIALQSATGTYDVQPSFDLGTMTIDLTTADINHDGTQDLLASGLTSTWLLNSGNGHLSPANSVAVGIATQALTTADFDQDGELDIAYAAFNDAVVGIAMNRGNIAFDVTATFPISAFGEDIVSADIDKDGDADIVAYSSAFEVTDDMLILVNDGTGVFTPHAYDVGLVINGMAVADLNGDGYVDIATIGVVGDVDTISLFLNNGDGTYGSPVLIGGMQYGERIVAADFDNDGATDLAVSDVGRSAMLLYRNPGNGTFGPFQVYPSDGHGDLITQVDLNADGRVDLISIGIFLPNTCMQ